MVKPNPRSYVVTVNRPRTRLATLHRLVPEVRPGHEDMFDAYTAYISARRLDELGTQLEFIDVAGAPAIWIGVQADNDLAGWCADASMTTGLDLTYTDCRCGRRAPAGGRPDRVRDELRQRASPGA